MLAGGISHGPTPAKDILGVDGPEDGEDDDDELAVDDGLMREGVGDVDDVAGPACGVC